MTRKDRETAMRLGAPATEPQRPDAIDDAIANWLAMSDYAHASDAYTAAQNLREVLDGKGYTVAAREEDPGRPADMCGCGHTRSVHTAHGCPNPFCDDCPAFEFSERLTELVAAEREAAARASQATTAPHSPTGGHGAAPDPAGGGEGRTEASVTVRQVDLAEALAYVIGADDITTLSAGAIDRLFTALKAASEQR